MEVTSLGDNLNVIVPVERSFVHDWMSFGLWYSLGKNAPDARIYLKFMGAASSDLFHWPSKFGVRVYRGEPGVTLVVPPHVILGRELDARAVEFLNRGDLKFGEELYCDARGEGFRPFISYEGGCGAFNWSEWINTNECPFDRADGLMTHEATFNEVKVLQVWTQLGPVYSTISKG